MPLRSRWRWPLKENPWEFPTSGSLASGLHEQEADAGSAEIPPKERMGLTARRQFFGRHR